MIDIEQAFGDKLTNQDRKDLAHRLSETGVLGSKIKERIDMEVQANEKTIEDDGSGSENPYHDRLSASFKGEKKNENPEYNNQAGS